MTEQEAIEILDELGGFCSSEDNYKACHIAIKALEEVQQYRAIGTPEECRNSVLEIPKAYNKAIDDFVEKAMPEFTKYDLEHGYPCMADIKGILRDTAEQLKAGVDNEQID